METHSTTDVRDLDCLFLATIGGADYFETRQIVRSDNGVRSVVGRASDWPLIQRDARIAELTALLVASERRSVEADCHVSELLARLSAYEELVAVSPKAEPMATAAAAASSAGAAACDHCDWRGHPKGLAPHKKRAHGVAGEIGHKPSKAADQWPENERKKCPYCRLRPLVVGMDAHIARDHPEHAPIVAVPTPASAPIAIALGEAPWRCDHCHESTHARSLKVPALCIRCVISAADAAVTNGHLAAA